MTFRFGIISSLIVFIYATNIQNVDPEEYGGIVEIIKEGFMTAFATFLVGRVHCLTEFFIDFFLSLGFMDRSLFRFLRFKVKYTVNIVIDCVFLKLSCSFLMNKKISFFFFSDK